VLRASFERLSATILGAGIACLATFGRIIHAPELLLIAVALSPLAFVAAHNSAYRTAMVAAIIVLSAPAANGAPLHVAIMRMLGVSLGALIGALVSMTILPSRREVVVARAVAKLLQEFIPLVWNVTNLNTTTPDGAGSTRDAVARDRFEFRVRQLLRELGLLVRDRADSPPAKGPAAAMVKFTVQMHADIAFLKRELQGNEPLPAPVVATLESFARAFEGAANGTALMARGHGATSDTQQLRAACAQAARVLRDECPRSEGSRLMLRRLIEDLNSLVRAIEYAGVR